MVDEPKITEDENGYSDWQIWHFMQIFGSHMGMLSNPCCSLNVLIDDLELTDL
jgi:hypothetical protein